MKGPPLLHEADRLSVLREYSNLDTPGEGFLDDVVQLAARTCAAPAAMLTLLDASRQWVKAVHGLPFSERHPDVSFCAHTIRSTDAVVVPDATRDSRFTDHPLVTSPPHIRCYAGVPLISPEGYVVGTLAIMDVVQRCLTLEQLDSLRILARQVVSQLELRRAAQRAQCRLARAEADVHATVQRHRAIVEGSLDAIVTIDADGRITEFNPAAEAMFGYPSTEIVGRLMADVIVPPEDREAHARGLARYLRTGHAVILGRRVEVNALRRDGTRFAVELSIHRTGESGPAAFTGLIRDISERVRVTSALRASEERYRRQRAAMTRLIRDERLYHGDLEIALRQITETVAVTLNAARVSVYRYERAPAVLRALDVYELGAGRHSEGTELAAAALPAYVQAIAQMEIVAANDPRHDPRTSELADEHLLPRGVTSMMSAAIHLDGALHGVLCVEHIGPPREWTPEDETFTVAAANLVSLALEGHQRRKTQEALVGQAEILTAVTESLAAYVERGDLKDAFRRLLRCALSLTLSEYGFVGVVVGSELRVLAHEGIVWDQVLNRRFYEEALRHYEEHGYLAFGSFDNLFGRAITSGQVVIANDPDRDSRARGRPVGHPPMYSFLGVPIRGREGVTGLVALANRPDGYGSEQSRQIEALVQQAGGLCDSYRQREAARALEQQREQAEAARRASDERLRIVARATNDAVWEWDLQTDRVFMPEGFGKLFGNQSEPPEVSLASWCGRIHPEDHDRVVRGVRAAIEGGAQIWSDEYRFRRADGSYAAVFDRAHVLRDEDGRPVRMIGAMMDISERKELEAQVRQSQKLEAVGQLAGGVAHDFNNLLTIIQGHASFVLAEAGLTSEVADSIREIVDAAGRAAGLTRQLLAFSRRQVLQPRDVDLNDVVGKMARLLHRILGEDVAMDIALSATPAFVRADPTMLEQVILNLAVNARDAMPQGGRLAISTSVDQIAADDQRAEVRSGTFVRLTIADSGCGISAEVLPHIFEPFFTTKAIDRGTGLGLATVYGVVKQHQGWVSVRSVPNEGTTFDVHLPAIAPPAEAPGVGAPEASEAGGDEVVLVVEDEPAVRELARRVLQRHGYMVLEAGSGRAALEIWREHGPRIDLLLTDLVMPDGLSGLDLAEQLLATRAGLSVLMTSGYSADLGGHDLRRAERVRFLPKPYTERELLGAVRACLDAR